MDRDNSHVELALLSDRVEYKLPKDAVIHQLMMRKLRHMLIETTRHDAVFSNTPSTNLVTGLALRSRQSSQCWIARIFTTSTMEAQRLGIPAESTKYPFGADKIITPQNWAARTAETQYNVAGYAFWTSRIRFVIELGVCPTHRH